MRCHLLAYLAILVVVPALWGLNDGNTKQGARQPTTPKEQYDAVVTEWDTALAEYRTALRAAKTNEDRQKVIQQKYPKTGNYADKMIELAEKYPDDPAAVSALIWAVHPLRAGERSEKAFGLLTKYAASKELESAFQGTAFLSPEAEKFLRAVMDKNPSAKIQAGAALALAEYLLRHAQSEARGNAMAAEKVSQEAERLLKKALALNGDAKQLSSLTSQLGRAGTPAAARMLHIILEKSKQRDVQGNACFALAETLKKQSERAGDKTSAEHLAKEAETFYERVTMEFADVKHANAPLADLARAALNEIRFLSIGKTAPDIAAEDTDGNPFRLSDYRGKVVLLDFWGNW
jgi:tetratricopeptide (TPR) repeat protein